MASDDFRYHKVLNRFWVDEKVLAWSDDTRLLALYLLTCPHRTMEGLFRLPKPYILADLQWSPQRLAEPFAKLLADGFLNYDETVSVVLLRNTLKYQQPENPNQTKAAVNAVASLPTTSLLWEFQRLAKRFSQRLHEALIERFGQPPTPTPTPTPTPETDTDRLRAHASEIAASSDEARTSVRPSLSVVDAGVAAIVGAWEQATATTPSAGYLDPLFAWLEQGVEPGLVVQAIEAAAKQKAAKDPPERIHVAYVESIVHNWHNQGIHTEKDAKLKRESDRVRGSPGGRDRYTPGGRLIADTRGADP